MKFLLLSFSMILASCTGGVGGLSEAELQQYRDNLEAYKVRTNQFVENLNTSDDFEVTIVKRFTDIGYDYIVVLDKTYGSYDAIDISGYDPNVDDAVEYYNNRVNQHFFDLQKIPAHYETEYDYVVVGQDEFGSDIWAYEANDVWISDQYWDSQNNLYFEKVNASPKDLAKVSALSEAISVEKTTKSISSKLGLSLQRSKEVANLQMYWKKANKKSMTKKELDGFTSELLGFSMDQGIDAYQASMNGDQSKLENLIQQSANINGITPEHASSLITKVFGL